MALNILHVNNEKIYPPDASKENSKPEKQVILLIILNGKG